MFLVHAPNFFLQCEDFAAAHRAFILRDLFFFIPGASLPRHLGRFFLARNGPKKQLSDTLQPPHTLLHFGAKVLASPHPRCFAFSTLYNRQFLTMVDQFGFRSRLILVTSPSFPAVGAKASVSSRHILSFGSVATT